MAKLTAGVATVDISPDIGHELAGYPHFTRPNNGVHDPLMASCLYLNDGTTQTAIVTMDLLFFSKHNVTIVRKSVTQRCDIPSENIMISCSHTHSGPWASGKLDEDSLLGGTQSEDKEYVLELNEKLIDLICRAKAGSFVAKVGSGATRCGAEKGIGGNRRDKNGVCDPSVNVISIKDLSGRIRGVFANYTLHPTFLHEDSTVVSADYPGYMRTYIKKAFPDAVFGFSQGTSGDQSSRYFRVGQSFDEADRVGSELGRSVECVVASMNFSDQVSIRTANRTVPLELREIPGVEEAEARRARDREGYNRLVEQKASYLQIQNANVKMLGAEDLYGYAVMANRNLSIDLVENERDPEIMGIAIGDTLIVGLPGEIFVSFGLTIKKNAGFGLCIVSELANGCMPGYVCTKEAIAEGGYEADTSLVHADMGEKMVAAALEIAQQFKLA